MKNRVLTYGYEVRNGKICVSGAEAEIVSELFSAYASGASFKTLAERLMGRGVPYHSGDAVWNKNKVARILGNATYLGTADYPALIDRDLYERAATRRPKCAMTEQTPRVKAVRELARCARCGGKIRMSTRRGGWTRWNCENCGGLGTAASTERIMAQVEAICKSLQASMISDPAPEETPADMTARKEHEFSAMLEEENFDEGATMETALALAAARYDLIGSADYETMRIRRLIERASKIDVNVLREIVSAILIHPDGKAEIKLRNGQTIGRDDPI